VKRLLNKKGFTLIEVLVGLVILAIGLLGIAGMQVTSVKGNSFSRNLTQASFLAQDRLEYLKSLPISNPVFQNTATYNEPHADISGLRFYRSYKIELNGTQRTITYTVAWNDGVNHSISYKTIRSL
jgi:prepilin-type N-terminal cleavage/methylation domain-containing protein